MSQPNLFNFATSELSQDAFICWLLSWANEEHRSVSEPLHQTAVALLHRLLELGNVPKPQSIRSIEIDRQHKYIDILVLVNQDIAIIIEDKTSTMEHSGQLGRYFDQVRTEHGDRTIARIYFKTGDQSNYDSIAEAGYACFLRRDFLEILRCGEEAGVKNHIFADFHQHLQALEDGVTAYVSRPVLKWDEKCWIGFYIELRKRIGDGEWGKTNNPQGGFWGFNWHWRGERYLQLEQEKLCFKIQVRDKTVRAHLWQDWHQSLMSKAPEFTLKIKRPSRRADGTWMSVAVLDEYRRCDERGIIDMDKTVTVLREAERLLDAAAAAQDQGCVVDSCTRGLLTFGRSNDGLHRQTQ